MTLDEAMKEIGRLQRENRILRETFDTSGFHVHQQNAGWWIFLDDYEIANLRSMIEAVGYCGPPMADGLPYQGPLYVFNSGDWIGQVYSKLPRVAHLPNVTPQGYREASKQSGSM